MVNNESSPEGKREFPQTAWTFIHAVQDAKHPDSAANQDQFVRRYWRPVFYFLRARNYPVHQAEDLTQEFFLNVFSRDWLKYADSGRGRFRTYLLTLVTRFLSDQGPTRSPRQQVFETRIGSIESLLTDQDRTFEPESNETPESVFMKRWALMLVDVASQKLREYCAENDHMAWYEIFQTNHSADQRRSQEAIGQEYQMSRDQVRHALRQTQKWFREFLLAEVVREVTGEIDPKEEVQALIAVL